MAISSHLAIITMIASKREDLNIFKIQQLHFRQQNQMQINKPDQGVLRGMGRLEIDAHINKKYFPRYTHSHNNDYLTSFQRFFSAKHAPKPMKPSQNTNASTLMLGSDQVKYDSLSRTDYRRFEKVVPPKPILQKEEGIALGQEPSGKAHFTTTVMEKFGLRETKERPKVTFRDRGIQRFNPITGQTRTQTFGFEDFTMGRRNNYIAHNVGGSQGYDIISGRKLTHN